MLPAGHRLHRRADFAEATRLGVRASRGTVVVHLRSLSASAPARVGFVVSKAVGGSVVRHRVTRRLRVLAAEQLAGLEPGTLLVVRALPAAAGAPSSRLRADLEGALAAAKTKAAR